MYRFFKISDAVQNGENNDLGKRLLKTLFWRADDGTQVYKRHRPTHALAVDPKTYLYWNQPNRARITLCRYPVSFRYSRPETLHSYKKYLVTVLGNFLNRLGQIII